MSANDDPMAWIEQSLADWSAAGLRREVRLRTSPAGAWIESQGRRVVNFGSNDYLNLAADPRVVAAAGAALSSQGFGAGASPLVTGCGELHARLERRLAEFEGAEAAMLFTCGYAANLGAVSALAAHGDAIFADELNHASLIDGCRLSKANVHVYRHADCNHLAELLRAAAPRRKLIVTDALFSMEGDLAPLADIAELSARHGAMLMVDEAHATGVFGARGRGVAEMLGVADCVHIRMGTLSKALGSSGGFIAGSRTLIEWLRNRARSYMFSTATPAVCAAAALASLDIVQRSPLAGQSLLATADNLRRRLKAVGWNTGDSASQIIPLVIGSPERAVGLAERLFAAGFWVPAIRPPAAPVGRSLLRVSLSLGHTPDMLADLLTALGVLAD